MPYVSAWRALSEKSVGTRMRSSRIMEPPSATDSMRLDRPSPPLNNDSEPGGTAQHGGSGGEGAGGRAAQRGGGAERPLHDRRREGDPVVPRDRHPSAGRPRELRGGRVPPPSGHAAHAGPARRTEARP